MSFIKVEKGSEKWFGITIILLSIMLVFTSLGRTDLLVWISAIFSIIVGIFLYREGGIRTWLMKKGYKSITASDFIVISSFIFGTFVILNGILLVFAKSHSGWFVSFIRGNGVIGGIITAILGIFLILTPKPKA
jgi:hypothetical protein